MGECHGLLVTEKGQVKGWGYNRQLQAIGAESPDTFVKPPQAVSAFDWGSVKALSTGCGGAQSYALVQGPHLNL